MNAQEAIAKQIGMQYGKSGHPKWDRENIEFTSSLLAMKQDCAECDGSGKVSLTMHNALFDGTVNDCTCIDCHGSGLSDLPVIAEVCSEQTLPENPFPKFYDDPESPDGKAITSSWEIWRQAQQDMLEVRVDKDGRKVAFRKVYVD